MSVRSVWLSACSLVVLTLTSCTSTASRPAYSAIQSRSISASPATAAQLASGSWSVLPVAPITPRGSACVAWSGSLLYVWGGASGTRAAQLHGDGAAFNPSQSTWAMLSPPPIEPRIEMSCVWTSFGLFVWGGYDGQRALGDGAIYDPRTQRWHLVAKAPISPRVAAIALWMSDRVVVVGGRPSLLNETTRAYGDSASYDPARDTWSVIPALVMPSGHVIDGTFAVASARGGLVFADWSTFTRTKDGFSSSGGTDLFGWDGSSNQWKPVSPSPDALPSVEDALWTGTRVIVRGITINCGRCSHPYVPTQTVFYDPDRNIWTAVPPDPMQSGRAVWTGAIVILNSGAMVSNARERIESGDGAAYDEQTRGWVRLPRGPAGCFSDTSPVWTGRQILGYCPAPGRSGIAFTPSARPS